MSIELDDTQPRIVAPPLPVPTAEHHLQPLTHAERLRVFGAFDFTPSPRPGNPEAIVIAGDWARKNIVSERVPQLGRRVALHRLVMPRFLSLVAEWERAKLLDRVRTFNGGYVARYKRGRSGGAENLSNHSWGTAFDINAVWNPLGQPPASLGSIGCVRELVPIAESLGWAWGGWWHTQDGMHFEVAQR
jgi:hypothetical protein